MNSLTRITKWPENRAAYLVILLCTPALSALGHFIWPSEVVFKGQAVGVLLPLFGCLIAGIAWWRFACTARLTLGSNIVLIAIVLVWLWMVLEVQFDNWLFDLSTFVVPIGITMVLLKPPTLEQARWAIMNFALCLVIVSVIATCLSSLGLSELAFNPEKDGENRLAILRLIGIETRWEGPFYSSNEAAPVGAFLLVLGFTRRKTLGIICILGGGTILILSQGRNAVVGAFVGLAIIFFYSETMSKTKILRKIRALFAVVTFTVPVLLLVSADPTLNGRVPIWKDFIRLFLESPWIGAGNSGIRFYLDTGGFGEVPPLPHAHGVYLDIAARYGLLALIFTIGICSFAIVKSFRSRFSDRGASFALVACVLLCGLAETTFTWIGWSVGFATLLSALLCIPSLSVKSDSRHSNSEGLPSSTGV